MQSFISGIKMFIDLTHFENAILYIADAFLFKASVSTHRVHQLKVNGEGKSSTAGSIGDNDRQSSGMARGNCSCCVSNITVDLQWLKH